MGNMPLYQQFLGNWELIPLTCVYEQGDAPIAGTYSIEETGSTLTFHMGWTDADGGQHDYSFGATSDGKPKPFRGGDLADSISVTAVSEKELNSAAYKAGKELMLAQRTLSDDGDYMEVRQIVRLPDLTEPSNFARYRRVKYSQ
ncbi:MAG: hypothetical protein JKY34_16090 [Kordiimonadaceae bacterium]|nr:hypothetical protein [Kordiimonadaceae bacterium]